ncbi:MAG: methyltransferase domain-containing protein [Gammaproteobacteria bacterium]|nr:methyltransferase domain-containing protein [Gammaproteobacteria bacterium]
MKRFRSFLSCNLKRIRFALIPYILFSAASAYADYSDAVSALNPTHYYSLNETSGTNAGDSGVGTQIEGTLCGTGGILDYAGPGPTDGFFGFATTNSGYDVRGTSSVRLGNNEGSAFAGEEMTVAIWFKAPVPSAAYWDRLFTNNQGSGHFFTIGMHNYDIFLCVGTTTPKAKKLIRGIVNLFDDKWHMIFAIRGSDNVNDLKLVVDGVDYTDELQPAQTNEYFNAGDDNARVSGRRDAERNFYGMIDEVGIWVNQELTVQDGKNLYHSALTGIVDVSSFLLDTIEGEGSKNYEIVLFKEPDTSHGPGQVIITATRSDEQITINGSTDPVTLTFNMANWDIPQTVTIAAVEDDVAEGSHTSRISHVSSSDDPIYDDTGICDCIVNIEDDDMVLELPAGPYVHFSRPHEVTVFWKTETAVPSILEYGFGPDPNDLTNLIEDSISKTDHELTITQVKPEIEYFYRVRVNNGQTSQITETTHFFSAFGSGPDEFPEGSSPYPVDKMTILYEQAADLIIETTGITKGVCIVYGCGEGRLSYEIAKRSDLKIIGFEENPDKVAAARYYLDEAEIYGTRVRVIERSLLDLGCRDYSANLIVSDTMMSEGQCPGSAAEMYRVLRPDGGVAYLGQSPNSPNPLSKTTLEDWLDSGSAGYTITEDPNGLWAHVDRDALSGAGRWTHCYANQANTAASDEQNVQRNLKLLWYGQTGPRYIIGRHNRSMPSLYNKGIVITAGIDGSLGIDDYYLPPESPVGRLMAYDAYNGTRYWDITIPRFPRSAILTDCGYVALANDYVYAAYNDVCVGLDIIDGKPDIHLTTPRVGGEKLNWGYVALMDNQIVGSGQKKGASLIGHCRSYTSQTYDDYKPIATSKYLFSMDRHTGRLLWTFNRSDPCSVIVNPCIAMDDNAVYFIESQNIAAVDDDGGRILCAKLFGNETEHYEYLVKLDIQTGVIQWQQQIELPYEHIAFLGYAKEPNLLIAVGTRKDNYYLYENRAFDPDDGSLVWSSNFNIGSVGGTGHHGEQDQHPCIIGNMLYSRYYKAELNSNGYSSIFSLSRSDCGTQSGCATHLFGRNGNPCMYELGGSGTAIEMTTETRPGCWINIIPAGGLILVPEASAGCTCDYAIQATTVFMPE